MSRISKPEDCLAGGGEMGARMRAVDWSLTVFGPVTTWPQSLRTAVSMLLESRFAMIVAWGPEFRFFYNDRYIPVLGARHPWALGQPAAEIWPEIWEKLIGPEFERTRQGEAFAIDDWYLPIARNGYTENCWFTVSYSPIRDESGGVGGMLAVVAETTGRVEGERRMSTLRELAGHAAEAHTVEQACANAALAFDLNPMDVPFSLIYTLDAGGRTARRLATTGLVADHAAAPETIDLACEAAPWPLALATRTKEPVVLADLAARFGELPGGAATEPTHSAILLPLVRPGLAHPFGVLIAGICPRRPIDDRYRGFFELAADHLAAAIGNAHALEEQRRRAEELAELDRVKTAFFSNVSHELRTPLTLMLGPMQELLAGHHGEVSPEVHAQHELVHRNALRLHKLVNAMLDFSRIEAGRARAAYEPTDLAAVTTELSGMFRAAIERAGLELVVDCPPLPEPVFVDREMWQQIVMNLLSNALKFTFHGRIRVTLRHTQDHVELAVRDTGSGIAAHELPRVFERFHRIEGACSRTHEGAGIGLALAQELARLHGGTIAVESEPGKGTQFTVKIRAGRAHLPADHVAAPWRGPSHANAFVEEALRWLPDASSPRDPPPVQATSGRVLVADDNADMRDYLRHMLEEHWQVIAAPDGATALGEIRRAPPDAVVTDVMMPGLDGFGLIAAMRADPRLRDIPVIVVSARAGDEARSEGLEAGADDYLVKPFSARELVARVGAQLANRRAAERQRRALYALFEQAPVAIAVVRGEELAYELRNRHDLATRGVRELVGVDHLRRVLETGEPCGLREIEVDGAWWNVTLAPIANERGVVDRVMSVVHDVTDEVLARRELARTVEYNEKFTAMLGHDLRNPLNAIMTTAQLIARRATTPDIARPAARVVLAADRMTRMISQLLDLARVRGGGLRLQPRPLDLAELSQLVIDELRQANPESRLELVASGSLHGRWDGDRIAQLLSNLAGNALEHGEPSGPVYVQLDGRDSKRVSIRVENRGEIAPEVLPVLFDPFRGVQHRSDGTQGLGLGLYISKEIVTAHRGTIDVRSSAESGTCFEIELPKQAEG